MGRKPSELISVQEGREIGDRIGRGRPGAPGVLGGPVAPQTGRTILDWRAGLLRACHGRSPRHTLRALRRLYRKCCGVRLLMVERGVCPCSACTRARARGWWDGAAPILPEDVAGNWPVIPLPEPLEPMPSVAVLATEGEA